ncbi:hypothetical protein H4R24_003776 [Coemansia sp. RSA 988]|nr:hypothetical protein H4R24_003776 [Coemansia sp. RSA 988]
MYATVSASEEEPEPTREEASSTVYATTSAASTSAAHDYNASVAPEPSRTEIAHKYSECISSSLV